MGSRISPNLTDLVELEEWNPKSRSTRIYAQTNSVTILEQRWWLVPCLPSFTTPTPCLLSYLEKVAEVDASLYTKWVLAKSLDEASLGRTCVECVESRAAGERWVSSG